MFEYYCGVDLHTRTSQLCVTQSKTNVQSQIQFLGFMTWMANQRITNTRCCPCLNVATCRSACSPTPASFKRLM